MNQTMNIHGTVGPPPHRPPIGHFLTLHLQANFLSWHRYYEWSWERVLREECNFKGVQPVLPLPLPLPIPNPPLTPTSVLGLGKMGRGPLKVPHL
jgi:hypothetical protein